MDKDRLDETLECLAPDCVRNIYPAGIELSGRDGEIRDASADAFAGARHQRQFAVDSKVHSFLCLGQLGLYTRQIR